ncbi:glycosyltransferase family 4 protein [Ammoniphilus sp. CFH 90114]|uniref:glycosyltransferase family 4 protein n=1 Tax=Ammoniphilus sp. CFH 90114 TaxID=2493665 RepID=UPI0013E9119A|nr:glycosyltransferase family 4 protein [Ammoniphilus sp. CFH 90114]
MKIAYVAPETRPVPPVKGGAVQLYMDEVLRRMAKKHRITLFSPGGKRVPNPYRKKKVKVYRMSRKNYLSSVARQIKRSSFHIVHTFNRPHFVSKLRKAAPKAKHVLNLHNLVKKKKKGTKLGIKKTHFFIANSHFTRRDTLRRFRIKGSRIRTVHLGVNPNKYINKWRSEGRVARLRRKWGVNGKKVVLFVGKITRKKGIHSLIRAAKILKKKQKNLLILVVGGPDHGVNKKNSYFRRIERLAYKKLGKNRVRFTGFLSSRKVAECYAIADVFVCPSIWKEPFGRVNIEAMASGLPVVASNRGGIKESVRHGKTGYLVNPRNIKKMAKYINRLLSNKSRRRKMGLAGYRLVAKKFSWHSVVSKLNKVYQSV